uniref:Obscurin-like protein n=1 Tax=Ginglymostoma cirratum TaxID=7801 RepID=V9NJF3_GINCI|nr:obscurin-like protein [Ginglymostoma cirratum]
MSQRFFCSTMLTGLRLSVFVLLSPVFTRGNSNDIYFVDGEGEISLKGPDNPVQGPVVWEWKPHSGQEKQQLFTFQKTSGSWWESRWDAYYRNNLYKWINPYRGTINLRLTYPAFKLAGKYTLFQTQPNKTILKEYNVFGIKVHSSAQFHSATVGSDVTLSCTISNLLDTVCLQWKGRDSSQQNCRKTNQIRVNNTVYLMVKHVTVEDERLYMCEVQEHGSIFHTKAVDFSVSQYLHEKSYTLYRSDTDHNELNLVCHDYSGHYYYPSDTAAWSWKSGLQYQERDIASASRYQPINVDRTHFGNRLVPTMSTFNGQTFNLSIVPVLFEDAGVYKCSLGSYKLVTITLITVKVTAEPSDAETEGDSITLTCSVSDVTESIRLVWINDDGKIVEEKALNGRNREEKSLRLIIQKADRDRGKWTCVLFSQNMPQVSVPYYLELSGSLSEGYVLQQEGYILLKGPDSPGNGSIIWEWRSHSGQQTTKQLGTFHREGQQWAVKWSDDYSNTPDISQRILEHCGTLNLLMRNPTFELGGLFTWTQTQPNKNTLKQTELFVIKVEIDSQRPVMGSDITLSCTISRLLDTVSLHWKHRDPSQQSRMINTDEIRLNNTVYLIVRHAGAENQNSYTWDVQENNSVILTGNINIDMNQNFHGKTYTLYRSVTDHSELKLICEVDSVEIGTKWTWSSHLTNEDKEIASIYKPKLVNISGAYFGSRLVSPVTSFTDMFFSVRIVPVLFEDAGVYRCSQGSDNHVTINLVTVKVTAEPSDAVTEGNTVTLTCTVSHVTEPIRFVWINRDGKIVAETTLKEQKQEEESLQLVIQEFDRDSLNWTCILFHQNTPKVLIPYHLKYNEHYTFQHTKVVVFGSLALLLIIVLIVVLSLRKCMGARKQGKFMFGKSKIEALATRGKCRRYISALFKY